MKNTIRNPIIEVLREINFSSLPKQSNFIKRDLGKSLYLVMLHFLYMLVINKKILTFLKQSSYSFEKESKDGARKYIHKYNFKRFRSSINYKKPMNVHLEAVRLAA